MKKILLGTMAAFVLTACSAQRAANEPLEHWTNFEQANITTSNLGENQSLLVFFREGDIQGPAANIYVNGNYQTSLLPNAVSPVAVCSAKNLLTTSFTSNSEFGNRTNGVHYISPVGEITYVKVIQDNMGKLNFIRVDVEEAKQAIAHLPKENHTLSRVPAPQNCAMPVLANATLDASALFKFDKSAYKDILPAGKTSIKDFVVKLPELGEGVEKVIVSGHTDPDGSSRYNQALSQKRATTVKSALQKLGVNLPIDAVGYGESQPVVGHCAPLKGKARKECNQPNRRVEITVYGNK